jgi:uncharacterized protein YfbU (UPF0304 family)
LLYFGVNSLGGLKLINLPKNELDVVLDLLCSLGTKFHSEVKKLHPQMQNLRVKKFQYFFDVCENRHIFFLRFLAEEEETDKIKNCGKS